MEAWIVAIAEPFVPGDCRRELCSTPRRMHLREEVDFLRARTPGDNWQCGLETAAGRHRPAGTQERTISKSDGRG